MAASCSYFKDYIAKAAMGDLGTEEQNALDQHLAECSLCTRELRMYAETVRQLRAVQDVPVPRHFFIYPEETRVTPWQAFLRMSRPWQAVAAAVLLAAGLLSTLAVAKLHVRSEEGAFVLAFGKLPERKPQAPQVAPVDTSALESRILEIVAEKNRQDDLELLRMLRAEMARSTKAVSREQRALLEQAIASVENRMGKLVTATQASLEKRNDRLTRELYRTVSLERARDMAAIDNRMSLMAINGEAKSTQTDTILATLLQVAELRMK